MNKKKAEQIQRWVARLAPHYKEAPLDDLIALSENFTKPGEWKLKDPLKRSFRLFCDHVWPVCLDLPALQEAQGAMADVISSPEIGPDGIGRLMLSAQRGAGKSYITAAYAVWFLYCHPNKAVFVASSTAKQASEILGLMRRIIGASPLLAHMVPTAEQGDSQFYFDLPTKSKATKDHSCFAAGIGSNITGRHPDLCLLDDIETPESSTASGQASLMTKIREIPSMVQPGGQIILLGTPHSTNSVYSQLGGLTPIVRFPCRDDSIEEMEEHKCAKWMMQRVGADSSLVGTPVFHERFTNEMLEGKESDLGEATFQMQYVLDTEIADVDRYPLKLQNLIVMDWDDAHKIPARVLWSPQEKNRVPGLKGHGKDKAYGPSLVSSDTIPFDWKICTIDASGAGVDQTGVSIIGWAAGHMYLLEAIGYDGDGTSEGVISKICSKVNEWDVSMVRIEDNFGGGMARQIYTPILQKNCPGVGVEGFTVTGNKERRIIGTLRPLMNQHRLIVRPQALRGGLLEQIVNISDRRGSLRRDDIIDSVASGAAYFAEAMAADQDKTLERIERKREEDARRLYENDTRSWVAQEFPKLSGATRVTDTKHYDLNTGRQVRSPRGDRPTTFQQGGRKIDSILRRGRR